MFPAEALAYELKARGYSVHLVTDSRAERYAGKFPADEIHVVPSATIGSKNPISVAKALLKLWTGLRAARRLVTKLKPVAVVGFGGYPRCRRYWLPRVSGCRRSSMSRTLSWAAPTRRWPSV